MFLNKNREMVKKYIKKKKEPKKSILNRPEWKAIEDLNRHYGVTIVKDDEVIDLSNPRDGPGNYIAADISRPVFPNCRKLSLCLPGWQQKFLFPQMPELTTLELVQSTIKKLYLHKSCYPNLTTLNLWGNQIYDAACLDYLKEMPQLINVGLADNPIAHDSAEREKLVAAYPNISFTF